MQSPRVAIIGGGPAGLMAAGELLRAGMQVDLFDTKPSVGRKFLLAGKGGLNLTHSEPIAAFSSRYGARSDEATRWLACMGPQAIRDWAQQLGIDTFVGTSGRIFPSDLKAAPLLRAWLHQLRAQGLRLHMRHRWAGWQAGDSLTTGRFTTPTGTFMHEADALVLALGGASWPQLGSDGAWVPWLAQAGVDVAPLVPANCGFDVGDALGVQGWSPHLAQRFAGAPLKTVGVHFDDGHGPVFSRQGECVVTATGLEGSLIYAVSARVREAIARDGFATVHLDLLAGHSVQQLAVALARDRGKHSLSEFLRRVAGLQGVKAALLRERWNHDELGGLIASDPAGVARELKHWPIRLIAARPIAEAISTAGGVRLQGLDDALMLRTRPGVFAAGEMLDWEAPTGGYLLTACLATGAVAARGVIDYLRLSTRPGTPA
jgi:uncharacterized flavoprotein (TIGR03862 family)